MQRGLSFKSKTRSIDEDKQCITVCAKYVTNVLQRKPTTYFQKVLRKGGDGSYIKICYTTLKILFMFANIVISGNPYPN